MIRSDEPPDGSHHPVGTVNSLQSQNDCVEHIDDLSPLRMELIASPTPGAILRQRLSRLPPVCQRILHGHYAEGRTLSEMAQRENFKRHNRNSSSASMDFSRCLDRLRKSQIAILQPTKEHFSSFVLLRFIVGELSHGESQDVEIHVRTCPACSHVIRELETFNRTLVEYRDTIFHGTNHK